MGTKLYVGNLPHSTSEDELMAAFGQFGDVLSAAIVTDNLSGRSRGFGFVEMNTDAEATAAIEAMNGSELIGRTLKVDRARPRNEQRPQQKRRKPGRRTNNW